MILRFLYPLLFFFLLLFVVRAVFSWLRRAGMRDRAAPKRTEPMVFDPQCRSYLPKSDAILRKGHYFCSEQCAQVYLSHEGVE
jgi:hypothetical protein